MKISWQKALIITLLLSASLFQGWPLIVAAQCRMVAAAQACEVKPSCCCPQKQSPADLGYSQCAAGKRVAGVLSTDPSLLSAKEKNEKFQAPSFCCAAGFGNLFENAAAPAPIVCDNRGGGAYHGLRSLFLLDCTFRI